MKKFFLIASLIIFAALLVGGAFFFFSKARLVQQTRQTVEQEKAREEKAKNPLQMVASQNTLAFWFFRDALLGISDDGSLFSAANASATPKNGPQPVLDAIRGVSPSQDGSQALVLNGDGSDSDAYIYNASGTLWQHISGRVLTAALSPDGKRIARIRETFGTGVRIEVAELDGSAGYSIGSVAPIDSFISWLTPSSIELKTAPSRTVPGYSFFIDINTKKVTPLALEKNGLMTLWSPSRERGLAYWLDANNEQKSAFIDASGVVLKYITSPVLPIKCAFASDEQLVCGVFRKDASVGTSGLPDEYLMGAVTTEDQIVSVDVQTGRITTLLDSRETPLDIFRPLVRDKKFYFINRYGGVYSFAF